MIFWIVLAVAVVCVFLLTIAWNDFLDSTVLAAFFALLAGGAILGVFCVIAGIAFPYTMDNYRTHDVERVQLVALGNGSGETGSVEGGLFAVYGVVGSTEHISYVADKDGAYTLGSVRASDSTVYQNAKAATACVRVEHGDFYAWWLLPWDFASTPTYTFHVPAGSVQSTFNVTANK